MCAVLCWRCCATLDIYLTRASQRAASDRITQQTRTVQMTCTATSNLHTTSTMIETLLQPLQQTPPPHVTHHQRQAAAAAATAPNKWLYEIRQRGQTADSSVATTCYVMVPNATVSPSICERTREKTGGGGGANDKRPVFALITGEKLARVGQRSHKNASALA